MPLVHVQRAQADKLYAELRNELKLGIKRLRDKGYEVSIRDQEHVDRGSGQLSYLAIIFGAGELLQDVAYCLSPGSSDRQATLSLATSATDGSGDVWFFYPVAHPLHPAKPAWARSRDGGITLDGPPYAGIGTIADSQELARIWLDKVTNDLVRLYSS
ncbi:MAG: hypothetical protein OXR82_00545 [Gammaproteobacteria bacterium]|nr:hypothetical protein [Gammaproteobacteria bacterium]